MEALFKYINGALLALISLVAPIQPVVLCALAFIIVDFVTGTLADRTSAKREGRAWFFESGKARRTIFKAGFTIIAIAMTWLVECCVLDFMELHLTRLLAGMVCGVEMWSILENASVLSDSRLFEWLRHYVRRKIEKEVGDEL